MARSIDTLFLDAGGVLVYPNWVRVADTLNRFGVKADATSLAAAEPHAKRQIDVQHQVAVTNDRQRGWTYFHLILARAGIEITPDVTAALDELDVYHRRWNLWEHVPESVVPALGRLRALGLRLVVVSNANGTLHTAFERLGLMPHFDYVLDSHVEGIEKPDPRFFQIALERAGARPESTLHVGDLYHIDVCGAHAAGLRAVLLDTANMYADVECARVTSLDELVDGLRDSLY